jgi:putative ABC transport system ATP-binding protein
MPAICKMQDVQKSYRGHVVLDGLTFTVFKGEMVAITGCSGAGKTTVLNLLGILEKPDRGVVSLFGRSGLRPGSASAKKLRRKRLGYLFQNFALIDNASVEYNLRVALAYSGATRRDRTRRIENALGQVGLPGAEGRKVYELSGGEQQRVAIARILLKPCDLVLADEPTGSLDAGNRDGVINLLMQMNARGQTIVLVTHEPEVASQCSRVFQLESLVGFRYPRPAR